MKTIKNTETGEVKRIQEKDAKQVLPTGWAYCSKSEAKMPKAPKAPKAEKNTKKKTKQK